MAKPRAIDPEALRAVILALPADMPAMRRWDEAAARLGVSTRSVRREVERQRAICADWPIGRPPIGASGGGGDPAKRATQARAQLEAEAAPQTPDEIRDLGLAAIAATARYGSGPARVQAGQWLVEYAERLEARTPPQAGDAEAARERVRAAILAATADLDEVANTA